VSERFLSFFVFFFGQDVHEKVESFFYSAKISQEADKKI